MSTKIVLISDDTDFFDYIFPKFRLRKNDELYKFSFNEIPEKMHFLRDAVLIVNSVNAQDETMDLLSITDDIPVLVFSYEEDEDFRIKAYKAGMFDFITLLTTDEELQAKLYPALKLASAYSKAAFYRDVLVKKEILSKNNEVFLDYKTILDDELLQLQKSSVPAILMAIAPDDKTKFLVHSNQIETIILSSIRKNDKLMNYAPNKYFLLLLDTDLKGAEKIWNKIQKALPAKLYSGYSKIFSQSREQLVNEVLNKLHMEINKSDYEKDDSANLRNSNFKIYRQDYNKNLQKIISPVFYQIQQVYNDKLYGVKIEQNIEAGCSTLSIKAKHSTGLLKITSPGFSNINIDVIFLTESKKQFPQTKRISLGKDELEEGLLYDIIEQFMIEFKEGNQL